MKKLLFAAAGLLLSSAALISQQALWGGSEIVSPEIHDDYTVTFRLQAPNATEVKITGDWMPWQGWTPGSEIMEKGEDGIWTYTTGVLEPELYSYLFTVDGLNLSLIHISEPTRPY